MNFCYLQLKSFRNRLFTHPWAFITRWSVFAIFSFLFFFFFNDFREKLLACVLKSKRAEMLLSEKNRLLKLSTTHVHEVGLFLDHVLLAEITRQKQSATPKNAVLRCFAAWMVFVSSAREAQVS